MVPSLDTNFREILGNPTRHPCSPRRVRYSLGSVEICSSVSTLCRYTASNNCCPRYAGWPESRTRVVSSWKFSAVELQVDRSRKAAEHESPAHQGRKP